MDRRALQELGDRLDFETDYRWLVERVAIPAFQASPSQTKWLVDAVRKENQVSHFRNMYGEISYVYHAHLNAPESVLMRRFDQRLREAGGDGEGGTYEAAIEHENERSARALIHIADKIYDTSLDLPEAIAKKICVDLQARGAQFTG